jgi:hypothetical protein
MKIILIFIAGYIARHIIGILFNRVFRKPSATQVEVTMDDIQDSVISYDRGKNWFVRTKDGVFVKVGYNSIQSILDFYENQNKTGADHTSADAASNQDSKR